MPDDQPHNLTGVLDRVEEKTDGEDTVRVEDILDAFSGRLFGPLIIVPGLVLLTPLGGIPLVPAAIGVLVAAIAGQRLFGRERPWVPARLIDRGLERDRVTNAFGKIRPWTKRVDAVIKPRITVLTTGPAEYAAAALAMLLGATIPVVGLIPFAAALPGAGLTLIGLALIARDGLLMIAALAVSCGVGYFAWSAIG